MMTRVEDNNRLGKVDLVLGLDVMKFVVVSSRAGKVVAIREIDVAKTAVVINQSETVAIVWIGVEKRALSE